MPAVQGATQEPRLPPPPVAQAAEEARQAPQPSDNPPPYPQAAGNFRRRVGDDDVSVYALLLASGTVDGLASEDEVRRAYQMAHAHSTTPRKMLSTIHDLALPSDITVRPHYLSNADRRLALGALLGIRVGFAPGHAQAVVDKARNKEGRDIAMFVAEECAIATGIALNTYGAYLIGGKAVAGATAKGAAIKAGGLGAGATLKATGALFGWIGVGVLAVLWGAGSAFKGGEAAYKTAARNRDVFEDKWFQDRRILEGIIVGEVVTMHPAKAARRARA